MAESVNVSDLAQRLGDNFLTLRASSEMLRARPPLIGLYAHEQVVLEALKEEMQGYFTTKGFSDIVVVLGKVGFAINVGYFF